MSGAPLSSVLPAFAAAHAEFHRDVRTYIASLSDEALKELQEAAVFVRHQCLSEETSRAMSKHEKGGRR